MNTPNSPEKKFKVDEDDFVIRSKYDDHVSAILDVQGQRKFAEILERNIHLHHGEYGRNEIFSFFEEVAQQGITIATAPLFAEFLAKLPQGGFLDSDLVDWCQLKIIQMREMLVVGSPPRMHWMEYEKGVELCELIARQLLPAMPFVEGKRLYEIILDIRENMMSAWYMNCLFENDQRDDEVALLESKKQQHHLKQQ